jgi:hypothetical protein
MSNFNLKFTGCPASIKCANITIGVNPVPVLEADWVNGSTAIDVSSYEKVILTLTNNGGAWNVAAGSTIDILLTIPYENGSLINQPSKLLQSSLIVEGRPFSIDVNNYPAGASQALLVATNIGQGAFVEDTISIQIFYV